MPGFLLARVIFVATVVYTAVVVLPIAQHPIVSGLVGLASGLLIVAAEARLRDATARPGLRMEREDGGRRPRSAAQA